MCTVSTARFFCARSATTRSTFNWKIEWIKTIIHSNMRESEFARNAKIVKMRIMTCKITKINHIIRTTGKMISENWTFTNHSETSKLMTMTTSITLNMSSHVYVEFILIQQKVIDTGSCNLRLRLATLLETQVWVLSNLNLSDQKRNITRVAASLLEVSSFLTNLHKEEKASLREKILQTTETTSVKTILSNTTSGKCISKKHQLTIKWILKTLETKYRIIRDSTSTIPSLQVMITWKLQIHNI